MQNVSMAIKNVGQLLDLINTQDTLVDKLLHTQAYMRGNSFATDMEDAQIGGKLQIRRRC